MRTIDGKFSIVQFFHCSVEWDRLVGVERTVGSKEIAKINNAMELCLRNKLSDMTGVD